MSDKSETLNPILAIAIQAKAAEKRQVLKASQALRTRFDDTDRFRRLASNSGFSISTGTPVVCTIH